MRIQGSPSLSALGVLATSLHVTANNIANSNTNEFKASSTRFETGPMDQGVRISEIRKDGSPGSYIRHPVFTEENGRTNQRMGWIETGNTNISRDIVSLISIENAYKANATVIRATDDMLKTLLDEIV